ncbi:MAG: acylphosphatase [Candidatus Cloacimonetes bacterium]|nr:acylphosphatase [Candidatus Cloacimonadota bacterium]
MVTWELQVQGRVQGVGYRWFVQHSALRFGVCGYVRNLYDGSVFILAQGEENVLEQFREAIRTGSHYARVDSLETNTLENAKIYHDFEIK